MTGNECFVDGGAYIGDTIDDFIAKTDNFFEHIYSFEYERNNYKKLQQRMDDLYPQHGDKIHLFNMGIYDKSEKGFCAYFGESDGTQLVEESIANAQETTLVSLDDVLQGKRVTVLKYDIEGAEMKGIKGARNILQEQKPKLAICLYHRPEDLWEIPCLINEINSNYKMIVKHHSMINFTDTVLYAI